ncbi:MAG: histidine phosphatase family protein [Actinobacteria bacterium]|nr:histidine phosphatase family protein [Actinomycetota bacterium]
MSDQKEYRQARFTRPPGATEILFVRHGESAPFREGEAVPLFEGHGDPPLDPVGEGQAEAVAGRLEAEDLAAIYVTTLQRTVQTAAPLVERVAIEPAVEPDLREIFLGDWEGELFRKYAAEQHPVAMRVFSEQRWDAIPNAESNDAFGARIRRAVVAIAARHPDACVAVFTHGGVIAEVIAQATGARPFAFLGADNGSISHVVIAGDRWIVRRFNDTAHVNPGFSVAAEPLI